MIEISFVIDCCNSNGNKAAGSSLLLNVPVLEIVVVVSSQNIAIDTLDSAKVLWFI